MFIESNNTRDATITTTITAKPYSLTWIGVGYVKKNNFAML